MNDISEKYLFLDRIQGARDYQEDNCAAFLTEHNGKPAVLLALADGMGGHVAGDAASSIALQYAVKEFQKEAYSLEERLRRSMIAANGALANKISIEPELAGMGTTLVIAVVTDSGLMWASVGDSPLWLCVDGKIERLNADHSMAPVFDDMVLNGRMTQEEALTDKKRNALRSAICGEDIPLIDVSDTSLVLLGNETLVLASDGVETLSETELSVLIDSSNENMKSLVEKVLSKISDIRKPNQDNASLVAFHSSFLLEETSNV